MMKFLHLVPVSAIFLAAASAASAAVDPGLLELAPPDSRVMFGMHVEQAFKSPFGQFAMARMPDHGAALLQLAATTGFDLRHDLREVLIAGPNRRGKMLRDGLMLARGNFQIDKLMSFSGVIHAKLSSYDSVPIITPSEAGASAIALLDSSTLAVGSEEALEGVINRRRQKFLFSGPLADRALSASAGGDAWIATVTPLARLLPPNNGGPFPAAFLQTVTESSASLRFDSTGVTVSAEALTHSPDEAAALSGLLRVVAGMVPGAQAAILKTAHFTTNGAATQITLNIAEQDLEQAFPAPAQGRAAR